METVTVRFKSVPIIEQKRAGRTTTTTYNMLDVRDHVLTFTVPNTHRERLSDSSLWPRMLLWTLFVSAVLMIFGSVLGPFVPSSLKHAEGFWKGLVTVMTISGIICLGAISLYVGYFLASNKYDKDSLATPERLWRQARLDRRVDDHFELSCVRSGQWDSFVAALKRSV